MNLRRTRSTGRSAAAAALLTVLITAALATPASAQPLPLPGSSTFSAVAEQASATPAPPTTEPAASGRLAAVAPTALAVRASTRPLLRAQSRPSPAVALHVPRLRLNKRLLRLHVQSNRSLSVPRRFSDVGWWSEGPRPGGAGAVIVGGHISSKAGPGAFYRLNSMRRGDLVSVDRSNGTTAVYQVRTKASYPRNNYPSRLVYRTTGKASIHLITCSGSFDPSIGHHVNNLVVSADLISIRRTAGR